MRKMLLASIAAAPLAFSVSAAGFAQDVSGESQAEARSAQSGGVAPAAASEEDNIVVVGTRRRGRTDDQSLVPIDVIQPDIIGSTGYSDLNDALRTLVPAFNVKRLPLNDGSSFVRPATLRSSPADHVLLLLNGRRRHRSATVQIGTGHATTSGSQGQDFNVIPPIALSSIEVLRDGASAQYGSDAIAGVINLTLKSAPEGGNISFETGQYFDDGGETADLQVNVGLPLTDAGFINLSAQYISQNETIRAGTHVGAQALRDMGVPGVPTPAMNTGDPQTQALKTVWNAGLDLGGGREAYLFGNYMQSDTEVGFFYRQSQAAGGLGQHATYADSAFDGTPAHPEIFNLASIYPGGYTPLFGGEQTDFSTVLGLSQEETAFIGWDASFRWGKNKIDYTLENSINASMGVESPTSFDPGSLAQREYELNLEAFKSFNVDAFASDIFLFGGLSYRNEEYTIGAGDRASYVAGPLIDLPVGSNGFQGYSPDVAGEFEAESYAGYLEAEADLTDRWTVSLAGRYENYEAFGDNVSYKFATRYDFNENFAIRGAMNSGFRAPAAGQLFGTSQTSQISPTGDFILDAVLVPGSDAAQIFGSQELVAETSENLSAGFVVSHDRFTATLDFYQIDVDDRLLLSDQIATTPGERAALEAAGYPNGIGVQTVRFFQNKLDTRVRGADLVTTFTQDWNNNNSTDFSLAASYNEQTLRSDPTGVFTPDKVLEFEEGIPSWRGTFSATHHIGDFDILGRAVYYGEWTRVDRDYIRTRDPEILFDAEIAYNGFDGFTVAMGARNLANTYPPPRRPIYELFGVQYDNHSPFGLSGGYYYVSLDYEF